MDPNNNDKQQRDTKTPPNADELKRRGDNVGQSARNGRGDPGQNRYGNEERFHSTEHSVETPAEPAERQPNTAHPNATQYEGRFPPSVEGGEKGDDKARYDTSSYAQGGGKGGEESPNAGDSAWEDQGGAGQGEAYGSGRDADGKAEARRKPS